MMSPAPQRSTPRLHDAFTLIELLVALSASAVLLAALLTTLGAAWRLQAQSQVHEQEELPRTEAIHRLHAQLLAAVPPSTLFAGPLISTTATVGTDRHDDVQWVTAVGGRHPDATGGDLVAVHYYLAEDASTTPSTYQLRRTEVHNPLVTTTTTTTPDEIPVLDHVATFACTWYDGTTWQDTWDTTTRANALPQAVQVHLSFAPVAGRTASPLDLLVPLCNRTLSALTASTGTTTATTGAATP